MNKGVTLAAFATISGSLASANVSWTFNADTQGWGTLNDAREFAWDGAIGQPEGAIRARDRGTGAIWYYSAPVADFGDASRFYGGEVSWDILGITGNQTSIPDRADVMIVGGGVTIGIDVDVAPSTADWTSWSAVIDASAGWRTVSSLSNGTLSGTAATQAQIVAALSNLEGFYIRGEYTDGADRTALDNVLVVPGPAGVAALGLAGLAGLRRRR